MLPTDAEYYTNDRGKITFYKECILPTLKLRVLQYFENDEWKQITHGYLPWSELSPINPVLNYDI